MRIDQTPAFKSAQAAYDNVTPYDNDCTCGDDDYFICDECSHHQEHRGDCPECDEPQELRPITTAEAPEIHPDSDCPDHGWCTGCLNPRCPDCAEG